MITLVYFSICMARMYDYYSNKLPYDVLTRLNVEIGYFIGGMMAVCALTIILTYSYMHKTFKETHTLRSSDYR